MIVDDTRMVVKHKAGAFPCAGGFPCMSDGMGHVFDNLHRARVMVSGLDQIPISLDCWRTTGRSGMRGVPRRGGDRLWMADL